MATRRRYTKREKLTAVIAADMTSVEAAAEAAGIPRTTLTYWLDQPEFVALRHNAREAMAEEAQVVARLAWQKLGEAIREGKLEPRDLVIATGMATDKAALLNGQATARTEHVDIDVLDTDTLSRFDEALYAASVRPTVVGNGNGHGVKGKDALSSLPLPAPHPEGPQH